MTAKVFRLGLHAGRLVAARNECVDRLKAISGRYEQINKIERKQKGKNFNAFTLGQCIDG